MGSEPSDPGRSSTAGRPCRDVPTTPQGPPDDRLAPGEPAGTCPNMGDATHWEELHRRRNEIEEHSRAEAHRLMAPTVSAPEAPIPRCADDGTGEWARLQADRGRLGLWVGWPAPDPGD